MDGWRRCFAEQRFFAREVRHDDSIEMSDNFSIESI